MVESLRELNLICQKPDYKKTGNWMVRTFLRDAALPITWLLLHTQVTANQVTLVALGIGLLGGSLLSFSSPQAFLAATLLLQLWYLLDHVDGQIARYRKTACLTGRFFDFLMHHLVHGCLWFFAGIYLYAETQAQFFVIAGFIGSFSQIFFNALYDIQYKTFFEKLIAEKQAPAGEEKNLSGRGAVPAPSKGARLFSFCHKLAEMHVVMNLLTVAAFVEWGTGGRWNFRIFLYTLYLMLLPALFTLKSCLWISRKKVDTVFQDLIINLREPGIEK